MVNVEGVPHIQKAGIHAGSFVAPILSEVFLYVLDTGVGQFLNSLKGGLIFVGPCMNDILICSTDPRVIME